jgi:peptidyl-prolyl cis-trans isomerase C
MKPGSWQGPIESGYGWHLVRIAERHPSRIPEFEEVEAAVRDAWLREQRAELQRTVYERAKARYEVIVTGTTLAAPAGGVRKGVEENK